MPIPMVRIENENAVLGIIRLAKMFPGMLICVVVAASDKIYMEIVLGSIEDFRSIAGELSILALGPLTNLAFRLEGTYDHSTD